MTLYRIEKGMLSPKELQGYEKIEENEEKLIFMVDQISLPLGGRVNASCRYTMNTRGEGGGLNGQRKTLCLHFLVLP